MPPSVPGANSLTPSKSFSVAIWTFAGSSAGRNRLYRTIAKVTLNSISTDIGFRFASSTDRSRAFLGWRIWQKLQPSHNQFSSHFSSPLGYSKPANDLGIAAVDLTGLAWLRADGLLVDGNQWGPTCLHAVDSGMASPTLHRAGCVFRLRFPASRFVDPRCARSPVPSRKGVNSGCTSRTTKGFSPRRSVMAISRLSPVGDRHYHNAPDEKIARQ